MAASIIAFLKALPELVSVIKGLKESINALQDAKTNREADEIKAKVKKAGVLFNDTTSREEMLKIMQSLGDSLNQFL